jgi:hypothetical protein
MMPFMSALRTCAEHGENAISVKRFQLHSRPGTKLLRFRPDKAARQCAFDQLQQEASSAKLNALLTKTPA